MTLVALVFADASAPAVEVAGGRAVDRQIRQLRHAGVSRILVLGEPGGAPGVTHVAEAKALAGMLAPGDAVLVVAAGLVLDERIVAAMLAAPVPAVATWPAAAGSVQLGTERIDAQRFAAGIGVYRAPTVMAAASDLGDWDLQSTLLRAALGEGNVELVDLAALDTYAAARRRNVPLVWALPRDAAEACTTDDMLIDAAQKGVLDWPARFLHPPVENWMVRALLPTPITPNMVTLFVAAISLAAGIAFAYGWMWTGLVLALISGPLDGVDGKLARVRIEFSRWGDLEHVLDKIAEYGWYLCIAGHLAARSGSGLPWAIAALIILFALAEALLGEFYRRFTGRQLDDAGPFERGFRLVGGRRNTFFWTLVPFGVLGAWNLGFVALAVYAVVTFFVTLFRFFLQIERFGRGISPAIEANFSGTGYAFLPGKGASATRQQNVT